MDSLKALAVTATNMVFCGWLGVDLQGAILYFVLLVYFKQIGKKDA